jgi:DNA-binding response OmpR family regulator
MTTRILITEDEPNIVESLTFILKRAGYDVSSVADGEAAVQRLRGAPPDIMILDLMLPKLNGFDVLKLVKTDSALRSLPVLVLSAKGQAHDRQLAEEIGADAFITKPFSNRDIIDQIGRLCPAAPAADTTGIDGGRSLGAPER